ncbi:two-component system, LuxR family, sensor kinase FixL [Neptunomonas japonica JAMM 1380]|uniref:histidine kinase n=2 Tax=Neptunomonas TaxID=75687 RepID=A0A7R6PRU7_9GAMM|nr:two-component system, LuxR family, sensor kinase FixL [Neptunomonas japonica JAMM 1380]
MEASRAQQGQSALTDDAERNRLLAEMAEQSTDMISRHTPQEWRFIYASPAVTHLLGYSVDEIIGMSAYELYHPDEVEDFKRRRPSVFYEKGFYTHTYRFRCKDGHYTWLESTSRSIRDAQSGELKEILVVSRDVSRRIEAEARMLQYQKELNRASRLVVMGEMASGLAHELNQPLTAIVNYARGIERRLEAKQSLSLEEVTPVLQRITSTAMRAGGILHRMMDFARKQEPVRERLDLHGLIDDLLEFCASSAAQSNVLLENRTPAILPQVMADRVQLEQVFLNLILNAIESCQTKPEDEPLSVWIDASLVKNEQVIISVYDQGEGLSGDVEQLFEQFFTTKAEGLGMGLSISRSLIEAHGGQLRGEKLPGKGSAFHVVLPLSLSSVEELNE